MNIFGWSISGVFLLVIAMAIFFGMMKGKKYTWSFSAARLTVLLLAVIVSVLTAKLVTSIAVDLMFGMFEDEKWIQDLLHTLPSAKESVKVIASVVATPILFYPFFWLIRALGALLVKPLTNLFLLIARKTRQMSAAAKEKKEAKKEKADIELLPEDGKAKKKKEKKKKQKAEEAEPVVLPAERTPSRRKKKETRKDRLRKQYGVTGPNPAGMVLGALCSVLLIFVLMAPVTGALSLVDDLFDEDRAAATEQKSETQPAAKSTPVVAKSADEPSEKDGDIDRMDEEERSQVAMMDTAMEVAHGLNNNVGTKVVNFLGGKGLYNWMTTSRLNGEKVRLADEAGLVTAGVDVITTAMNGNATEQDLANAIRSVGPAFSHSQMVPSLTAEMMAGASKEWLVGSTFCGIPAPKMGDGLQEMSLDLWNALKDSTVDTVKTDVNSLVTIVASLVEHDATHLLKERPMDLLRQADMIEAILYEFLNNKRLCTVVESGMDFGLNSALTQLEVPKTQMIAYENYFNEFVAVTDGPYGLNDKETVADRYEEIFNRYGLTSHLTREALVAEADRVVNGSRSAAALAKDFATADNFAQKSILITVDLVLVDGEDALDPKTESKALSDAFSQLLKVLDDLEQNDPDMTAVFRDFGPAVDYLASTKVVGPQKTALFLTSFLQSKSVRENCYFTTAEATAVAESIVEGAKKDSYATMLKTLGDTLEVIEKAAKQDGVAEEDLAAMLATMTPESAKVITAMSTPDVIQNHGATKESAEKVAQTISDIFTDYADRKDSLDEAQQQKEAEAMTNLINVMLSTGDRNSKDVFGADGVLGMNAEQYVDSMMSSLVLSDTLVDLSYDENGNLIQDPLKIEKSMSATEQNEMVGAMNTWYTGATAEEQQQKEKLAYAMAALMNMQVTLTDGRFAIVP